MKRLQTFIGGLDELSFGKSNKEIAYSLDMTDNRVKFHLKVVHRLKGLLRNAVVAVAYVLQPIDWLKVIID